MSGTGASYLQDLIAAIAIGERCPVISFSETNGEENEKRLMSAALAQQPIIALDNLSAPLMGDFLCQLISQPVLQIRGFGTLELKNIVNNAFVMANGNNLVISADTVRRVVQVALDTNMENPETRAFKRDPVAEVLRERGKYVHAVLTIARAQVIGGARLPRLANFERWSDLVRSALVWLGWPDPAASVARVRAEDPVRSALLAVITAWSRDLHVNTGYRTSEIIRAASDFHPNTSGRIRPDLWDALLAVAPGRLDQIDPAKLGLWLNKNVNRVVGNRKLVVDRESDKVRPKWLLVPV
jgi:putative DNA primase/helicase